MICRKPKTAFVAEFIDREQFETMQILKNQSNPDRLQKAGDQIMEMKILAMYLPQFHRVKENDEWWGDGYTDWVCAKKAVPYFEGQNEPRIPEDDNYYDLLSKSTMEWQASLMHQYGIDGMCIYHYWFRDGRKILEKPVENLLSWKDIDMPYCFCWDNQMWARSWTNIPGANWWYGNEKDEEKSGKGILLEQDYGDSSDWKKHFCYLLPFFKDKRYVKVDEKPVFVFYKPEEIPCLSGMLGCWDGLAKAYGFKGIYTIGANRNKKGSCPGLDAELYHQPTHIVSLLQEKKMGGIRTFHYDKMWEYILSEQAPADQNVIFGGFVDFDDTPRKGEKGFSVTGSDPVKFQTYFTQLIAKNEQRGNQFVFINAWNEWGEGMYLEPDKKNRDAFLQAVKKAKEDAKTCSSIMDMYAAEIDMIKSVTKFKDKIESYFHTLDQWLTVKRQGGCLEQYFKNNHVKEIGIYGYGVLGRQLVEELYGSDIRIKCIIDQNVTDNPYHIKMQKSEEQMPKMDMMVVTAYYFWSEIIEMIGEKCDCQVVSLETIVDEML